VLPVAPILPAPGPGYAPGSMSVFDSSTDVAIVGAGPYGLSLASHLTHRGVEHRIFGQPMHTWQHMFPGMGLKSPDFGTNVYTPTPGHTFVEWLQARGRGPAEPIMIAWFAEYGQWAQERLVPELERCLATTIGLRQHGFEVVLDTGERVLARRVVMATGLTKLRRMPRVFAGLPVDLVSHTSDRNDLTPFRGRDVTVIGAGQSALEAATLLHEIGAKPTLLVRGNGAWFADPPRDPRPLSDRLTYPKSVLGPGRLNVFLEKVPYAAHHLPEGRRVRLTRTHLGPWGAWWLRERFDGNVEVRPNSQVVDARPTGSGLRLTVHRRGEPSREMETDHVICGTGYEADLDRTPALEPALVALIDRVERAPRLSRHFESSVTNLYFVGAASAFSFGPITRFVCGAAYTAPTLARRLARTARSAPAIEARSEPSSVAVGAD
jgi:FAD-dependent urate hydroxylase